MIHRSISFAALLVVFAVTGSAMAQPFHFTVTADPRDYHTTFGNVLQAINDKVGGPGAFHITAGDYDNTLQENRDVVTAKFPDTTWYPVVGNHETETEAEMAWVRAEYTTGHGAPALQAFTNKNGPAGSAETTYSWDHNGAHFVAINEYWNGGTAAGSDTALDGNVVSALRTWLANDLAANKNKPTFVIGHEPAYLPAGWNHYGDSLDKYDADRNAFWQVLIDNGVEAYLCGHTHTYRAVQPVAGGPWQIDAGNAGNASPQTYQTFVDVAIDGDAITYSTYQNSAGSWQLAASWTQPAPEPATMTLLALGGLLALRRRMARA